MSRPPPHAAVSKTFLWAYHRSLSHAFARAVLELPTVRVWHEVYLASIVFGRSREHATYSAYGPRRPCSDFDAVRDRLRRWDGEPGSRGGGDTRRGGTALAGAASSVASSSVASGSSSSTAAGFLWEQLRAMMMLDADDDPHGHRPCCSDPNHADQRLEPGPPRRHLFVKCSPLYQLDQNLCATLPLPAVSDGPCDFRHTFLIRRPDKVALSLCKLEAAQGGGRQVTRRRCWRAT